MRERRFERRRRAMARRRVRAEFTDVSRFSAETGADDEEAWDSKGFLSGTSSLLPTQTSLESRETTAPDAEAGGGPPFELDIAVHH